MKVLVAGHDSLEFGWCVARWVPAVRKRSREFDKTIVVCRTGHDPLYSDFADEIIHCDPKGNSDRWLFSGKKIKLPKKVRDTYPKATVMMPRWGNCVKGSGEYVKYGQEPIEAQYDVIFHARAMTKYHQKHLNYPVENYVKVLKEIGVDSWRCASIGSKTGARHVPRTNDLRGMPLDELTRILANSKVCVGTSSGPLHLASFCGCPHVVITGREYQKAIKTTNRKRYEKLWNPFDSKCIVLDKNSWQPQPHKVAKAVRSFL